MRHNTTIASWRPVDEQPPPARVTGRSAGFVSEVVVPASEAAITGILLATLTVAIAGLISPENVNSGAIWLIAWSVTTSATWLIILWHTRGLLASVERITHVDINGDGKIGKRGQRVTLMNPRRAQAEAEKRAEDEDRSRFRSFVVQLERRGTDLRAWEKLIGRETYTDYRNALFAEGYAGWTNGKNDRNGWKLLAPVDEVLESIME